MKKFANDEEYWTHVGKPDVDTHEGKKRIWVRNNCHKSRIVLSEIFKHNMFKKRVLEIGVGSGIIASSVKRCYLNEIDYLGIDISESFLAIAQNIMDLNVTKARATRIPSKNDFVDFVFMFDVFEHIKPEDREQVASEINRILKPGGTLIMNSPLMESFHEEEYDFGIKDKDSLLIQSRGLELTKRKVISYSSEVDYFRCYLYEEYTKK